MPGGLRIGTAGWVIPKACADAFPDEGSHLQRYAARFCAAEINSSFYRHHKPATYARWAASVPPGFRFAVKLPREITHAGKLMAGFETLERFLSEVAALGACLGPLLIQTPPSLAYDAVAVRRFLKTLRAQFDGALACEPRDLSWFEDGPEAMLADFRVARVAADPALTPRAAEPGGWPGLVYRRLHGSPRMYYSGYSDAFLDGVADAMRGTERMPESWCIFDNTALGEACRNALDLTKRL
jgi:uncharacterized protein YecE (DUF72 family)